MATKKPLCNYNGQVKELQIGDTLPGTAGSSPLTTKGDLYGFDTGDNRLPVGSNGQQLVAKSSETMGIAWDNPPVLMIQSFGQG